MNKVMRRATRIMLIRHAEKPSNEYPFGVDRKGREESESLSVRGWQRAGALAAAFGTAAAPNDASAVVPWFLYAAKPKRHGGSFRPVETLLPLAEKLEITINTQFLKIDHDRMIEDALSCPGVVIICWQHDFIPKIAARILDDKLAAPVIWPENRFDLIWSFDKMEGANRYEFNQISQNLLAGDNLSLNHN